MKGDLSGLLAAVRAHPWAILPEYLEAIEAIIARVSDADILTALRGDGHEARIDASRTALAAVGERLDGAVMSTVRNGAAVIPVLGAIFPRSGMISASADGSALDAIMRDFRVALSAESVDRIVMLVDSPGGIVSGLGEAAETIRAAGKPVTAYVTGIGASAAYWLASQAGEIVLDSSASVGSIGVVASMSRQVGPGSDGRRSFEVVSSNAPMKRPDPETEEGRASIQAEVDAVEAVFIADVAAGRKVSVDKVRSDFGRGAMVAAATAVRSGMADRIGTLESVLAGGSPDTRRAGNYPNRRRALAAEISTRRLSAKGA
jgi:ClpP class serine protease